MANMKNRVEYNFIKKVGFFIAFILLLLSGTTVFPQDSKSKLEKDKKKIEEEIEYNSRLLDETKKTQKSTLNQLVILKKQISSREKLISNINEEIKTVNEQIDVNNEILKDLNNDLEKLKEEYAAMIYYAHKNRSSYDRLMFIFSSSDFNQAYKRLKYFQQYSAYRKTQVQLIEQTQAEIKQKLEELENMKLAKLELLKTFENEKIKLHKEQNQQSVAINELNKKEKELLNTIKEKEKAAKKLQKEIEKIIAEEINLASKKSGTTKTGSFALTPGEVQLSADFQLNKGGLPWPTERGIVSGTYGEHPHPVLKNVITKNNGIDILTEENAKARAVFNGEVTRVMSIPNYNFVIMIRHGEFLTVYSNLSEVFVQKGDKVTTKQEIGNIHTDAKDSKTELHFELWQGKTLLNPSLWLAGEK
jgi:septal ring factor EnvC (AmiA/AmiB activator)